MDYYGHFDGAARGNPGPAGAGAVLFRQGLPVWRRAQPLGERTNNEAEYLALKLLMEEMASLGLKNPEIRGDSRLVICQMSGQWKIKEPRLQKLAEPLKALAQELGARFRWVPREQNAEADRLSNYALDRGPLEERASSGEEIPAAAPSPRAPFELEKVSSAGWLVKDQGQEYLLDGAHRCCSCPQGRSLGKCRHMEALADLLREEAKGREEP